MESITAFINYLETERRYASNSVIAYRKDLMDFQTFIQQTGATNLHTLSYQDIRLFLAHLNELGLKRTTISRKMSALRSYYDYAMRMGWIESNPMELVQYSVKKHYLPTFFYEDEMEQLFDAVKESDSPFVLLHSALIELLYASGMRVSEVSNLTLDQLNFDLGMIHVIGKGDKERIVPIGDVAMKQLTRYLQELRPQLLAKAATDLPYVFISKTGKQLKPTMVRKMLQEIVDQAGLKLTIHPHKLRHTFATHLLSNGADLRSVQELLGHVDLSSTQIYTHITKDQLRKNYLEVFPRAKQRTKEE